MGKQLVSVNDLSFKYNEDSNYALRNVSFSVQEGEWLAIVGHNGSGKSTLARILNGLLLPEKGTITIGDVQVNEESIWEIRRRIGMVFQNPDNQFVGTTVKDDVAFGLENNGVPREEMIVRVEEAIKKVNMEAFLDQEPHHLSGGQKQRVAIAGVLAVKPDLIILDESTSMLDPKGRKEVLATVRDLNKQCLISVISITHDLEEAAKADRMIVMNNGEIFAEGSPTQIFTLDNELIKIGLDLPFSVKLSKQLMNAGFPLSMNHLTDEGLVNELWTLRVKS